MIHEGFKAKLTVTSEGSTRTMAIVFDTFYQARLWACDVIIDAERGDDVSVVIEDEKGQAVYFVNGARC